MIYLHLLVPSASYRTFILFAKKLHSVRVAEAITQPRHRDCSQGAEIEDIEARVTERERMAASNPNALQLERRLAPQIAAEHS
jgi:hypothetical protein